DAVDIAKKRKQTNGDVVAAIFIFQKRLRACGRVAAPGVGILERRPADGRVVDGDAVLERGITDSCVEAGSCVTTESLRADCGVLETGGIGTKRFETESRVAAAHINADRGVTEKRCKSGGRISRSVCIVKER